MKLNYISGMSKFESDPDLTLNYFHYFADKSSNPMFFATWVLFYYLFTYFRKWNQVKKKQNDHIILNQPKLAKFVWKIVNIYNSLQTKFLVQL